MTIFLLIGKLLLGDFFSDLGLKVTTSLGITLSVIGVFYISDELFRHQQIILKVLICIFTPAIIGLFAGLFLFHFFATIGVYHDRSPDKALIFITVGGFIGFLNGLCSLPSPHTFEMKRVLGICVFCVGFLFSLFWITVSNAAILESALIHKQTIIYNKILLSMQVEQIILATIAGFVSAALSITHTRRFVRHLGGKIGLGVVVILFAAIEIVAGSANIFIDIKQSGPFGFAIPGIVAGVLFGVGCGEIIERFSESLFIRVQNLHNIHHIMGIIGGCLTIIGFLMLLIEPGYWIYRHLGN